MASSSSCIGVHSSRRTGVRQRPARALVDASLAGLRVAVLASLLAADAPAQAPIVRVNLDSNGAESKTSGAGVARVDAISDDGRYVVFASGASDLVPGDGNGRNDVFLRDLVAGTTTRLSVAADGTEGNFHSGIYGPTISGDGRFVAFDSSADNLVADDGNGAADIFLLDRDPDGNGIYDEQPIALERVSVASDGAEGDGPSEQASLSADGNKVAFRSWATNLVAVDLNGTFDVFVRNRAAATTIRASRNNANVGGDDESTDPHLSADGKAVVFRSKATNFGSAGPPVWQVWVRDLAANVLELASTDAAGARLDWDSFSGRISGDGRFVVFHTGARIFPDIDLDDLSSDVFLKDRQTGTVSCMTIGPDGLASHGANSCVISSDGRFVAFVAFHDGFVAGDTNSDNDLFVRDVATGEIRCANIDCAGAPGAMGLGTNYQGAISADGRYALFASAGTTYVDDDSNIYGDLFVHDLANPGFQASWGNYGAGWQGTLGVPSFTLDVEPEFGATVTATAQNSLGRWTVGFLAIGHGKADWPVGGGGSILVDFATLTVVTVPPAGFTLCGEVPYDPALCEVEVDLQLIAFDPGAAGELSFTPGLEVIFGR